MPCLVAAVIFQAGKRSSEHLFTCLSSWKKLSRAQRLHPSFCSAELPLASGLPRNYFHFFSACTSKPCCLLLKKQSAQPNSRALLELPQQNYCKLQAGARTCVQVFQRGAELLSRETQQHVPQGNARKKQTRREGAASPSLPTRAILKLFK